MPTCAIIGAGFSGIALLSNLLKVGKATSFPPLKILLIEKGTFAEGVAYATQCPAHLLNTPAWLMSLFPKDPGHFLRWAQKRDSHIHPKDYVPRMLYGEYLKDLFKQAEKEQSARCSFQKIQGEAISVQKTETDFEIQLKKGLKIQADMVVLAMGNYSPPPLPVPNKAFLSHPNYYGNPYVRTHEGEEDVLIIGTGLSMVDQVLQMQQRGYTGTIRALSRHGYLPYETFFVNLLFDEFNVCIRDPVFYAQKTARSWLRYFREKIEANDRLAVLSALSYLMANVTSFPKEEEARYIRHLSSFARRISHSIPEQVYTQIQSLIEQKKLFIHAGSLIQIEERSDYFHVAYRPRRTEEMRQLTVGALINCLSPAKTFSQVDDPLLNSLHQNGMIRLETHHLLLDRSSASLQVIDAGGQEVDGLYALGSLVKDIFSSAIPVPAIRREAQLLANQILLHSAAMQWMSPSKTYNEF